jgi:tetratricopeptide (TPR) repeat protein
MRVDTAIILLTRGIAIDPEDLDLYVRRANINFLINHTKRALDDYLKILKTGDTTFIYLKRAGIGYSNNLQPKESNVYLKLAFKKDTTDYETATFLAQNYDKLGKPDTAIYYYKRVLKILDPIVDQASITSIFLAESLKDGGYYKEAIDTYLKCMKTTDDINLYMIVANLYDEKFNDIPKAIYYYQKFVDNLKNARMNFSSDYTDQVKKRLEFLKVKQKEQTIKK